MSTNEEIIRDMNKLLEEIKNIFIGDANNEKKIYRGQNNLIVNNNNYEFNKQNLNSSWKRRYNDDIKNIDILLDFWRILSDIFYKKNYFEIPFSEIAYMQHNEMPTPLIDFTNNILYALFFAFIDVSKNINIGPEDYSSIYVLEITSTDKTISIEEVNNNNIPINHKNKNENNTEKNNLEKNNEWYINKLANNRQIISCLNTINNTRAIKQGSYFIIDSGELKKKYKIREIKISHLLYKDIKIYLEKKDIRYSSVYPDLKGRYMESSEKILDMRRETTPSIELPPSNNENNTPPNKLGPQGIALEKLT